MKEEQLRKGDTQMVEFDVMVGLVALLAERSRYYFPVSRFLWSLLEIKLGI